MGLLHGGGLSPHVHLRGLPTYADLCGLFIDWLAETWKGTEKPKLAFLTWDSTYGKAVLYDEVMEYAAKKGVEVVARRSSGSRTWI